MEQFNIDEETIAKLGLCAADTSLNAHIASEARVFAFPNLSNVYVMESDLYGNTMPKGSCFLAFNGRNGLVGKHIRIETLRNSTEVDIQKMVEDNQGG